MKKFGKALLVASASLLAMGTLASCNNGNNGNSSNVLSVLDSIEEKVTLEVSIPKTTIAPGESAVISATVSGTTDMVTYASSDTKIATVDKSGKVTGVAEGSCTITVSVGDVSKTIDIKVDDGIGTITIKVQNDATKIAVGKSTRLAAKVEGFAKEETGAWSLVAANAGPKTDATIDTDGTFYSGSIEDSVTITYTYGEVKQSVVLEVTAPTVTKNAAAGKAALGARGYKLGLPMKSGDTMGYEYVPGVGNGFWDELGYIINGNTVYQWEAEYEGSSATGRYVYSDDTAESQLTSSNFAATWDVRADLDNLDGFSFVQYMAAGSSGSSSWDAAYLYMPTKSTPATYMVGYYLGYLMTGAAGQLVLALNTDGTFQGYMLYLSSTDYLYDVTISQISALSVTPTYVASASSEESTPASADASSVEESASAAQ